MLGFIRNGALVLEDSTVLEEGTILEVRILGKEAAGSTSTSPENYDLVEEIRQIRHEAWPESRYDSPDWDFTGIDFSKPPMYWKDDKNSNG